MAECESVAGADYTCLARHFMNLSTESATAKLGLVSQYDPATGIVHFAPNATVYQRAHEYAHQVQHRHRTRAWRVQDRCERIPYLCRLTRLWVEMEARDMALTTLQLCGRCDHHARAEARAGLWSYVRALFWA